MLGGKILQHFWIKGARDTVYTLPSEVQMCADNYIKIIIKTGGLL